MSVIPPPYVISEDDKRGLVVVMTAVALSFVWTCFLIRSYVRFSTREWRFRPDDYLLIAATVLDTVQSVLVFRVVDEGLGRSQESLTVHDLQKIGKDGFISEILYVVTLLLSKCAVLALYLRLSPQKGHTIASWTSITVCSIWAVMAVALAAVPCNSMQFWPNGSGGCPSLEIKWIVIGAIDILTEVLIFLIAIYLVVGLHMGTKSKILVVAAFSARLPVIAAAAVRLVYLTETIGSTDRTRTGAYYVVSTQWQLGYAIMACTITGLGPFLRPFDGTFSSSYPHSSYAHHRSATSASQLRSGDEGITTSYQLSDLKSKKVSVTAFDVDENNFAPRRASLEVGLSRSESQAVSPAKSLKLRPDVATYGVDTAVSGGDGMVGDDEEVASNASGESRRWIIMKTTELRVDNDCAKV